MTPPPPQTVLLLLVALVVAVATLVYHSRMQRRPSLTLRPLPALDALRLALGRGAETGRALHLSPGSGAIGNRSTSAETIAGLLIAERVASEAALNGAPILASSGDAVAHLALRGTLRQAYSRAGQMQDYDAADVQLLAQQDPMAYAAGVATLYRRQRLEASQLFGSFGQEVLLLSEEGAQRTAPQIAATTSTTALPLLYLSAQATLIGEELYAAEAYLASTPVPQARLLTQDVLRTAVIVLLVGGLVYAALQPVLGLPALPGA
ncbi:MAG: hypothetical protein H7Y32_14505 [Chloroflexales bacterium]|nr:hypothetical protein [Chloroflexales bacterium]